MGSPRKLAAATVDQILSEQKYFDVTLEDLVECCATKSYEAEWDRYTFDPDESKEIAVPLMLSVKGLGLFRHWDVALIVRYGDLYESADGFGYGRLAPPCLGSSAQECQS